MKAFVSNLDSPPPEAHEEHKPFALDGAGQDDNLSDETTPKPLNSPQSHPLTRRMSQRTSIKLSELNDFISCPVCHGYLIDATTVNECLHTFCKSCIVKHIKNNNNDCPKCNTVIHEHRPFDYILHDRSKQDIVYKLVPQLYISEMLRKMAVRDRRDMDQITRKVVEKKQIFVALVQRRTKSPHFTVTSQLGVPEAESPIATTQEQNSHSNNADSSKNPLRNTIYLRCSFDVRVYQLRKLLAMKYQLGPNDRVSLLYKGDIVSDDDQISNLAQSLSFILNYEISRLYHASIQASTSSSTMSTDSCDKMSVDEIK